MSNGSAPSADAPGNESSTIPTDGQTPAQLSTVFPMTAEDLSANLIKMYAAGWDMARALPGHQAPPPVDIKVEIDHDSKQVNVTVAV